MTDPIRLAGPVGHPARARPRSPLGIGIPDDPDVAAGPSFGDLFKRALNDTSGCRTTRRR